MGFCRVRSVPIDQDKIRLPDIGDRTRSPPGRPVPSRKTSAVDRYQTVGLEADIRRTERRPGQPNQGIDVLVRRAGGSPKADLFAPKYRPGGRRDVEGAPRPRRPGPAIPPVRSMRPVDPLLGVEELMDMPAPDAETSPADGVGRRRKNSPDGRRLRLGEDGRSPFRRNCIRPFDSSCPLPPSILRRDRFRRSWESGPQGNPEYSENF